MKKRLLTALLIATFAISSFTGCAKKNIANSTADILSGSPFVEIPGEENLVYHSKSSSVYVVYFYRSFIGNVETCSISAPYIQNGHFCEYRDGEIVEVIE